MRRKGEIKAMKCKKDGKRNKRVKERRRKWRKEEELPEGKQTWTTNI